MSEAVNSKHPWRLILAASGLIFLAAAADGADIVNPKHLKGVWLCASAVIDGKPLAGETVRQLRLTLTADRYKSERGDQVLFDSTYAVDVRQTPPQIDMIGTEGELKGKAAPGIFKLDGDTLTLCYVMPGGPRPTAFDSQPQSGVFLVVYKRAGAK